MAKQQLLLLSSFQLGLRTLLGFVLGNKQNPQWKMDQKILVERGIRIPNENIYIFTPTK
jgi:hypothetical protein